MEVHIMSQTHDDLTKAFEKYILENNRFEEDNIKENTK